MKGEQPSPRRRFLESVPETVALFRPADPREEVIDRRLEAVFPDVEVLVHEEVAVGGELGEFHPSVLLEVEPQVGAQVVHRPHLGLVFPVPWHVFHPIVAERERFDRRHVGIGTAVGELGPFLHAAFQALEDRAPARHPELGVGLAEAMPRGVEGGLHVGVPRYPAGVGLPNAVHGSGCPRRGEPHLVDQKMAGKRGFLRPGHGGVEASVPPILRGFPVDAADPGDRRAYFGDNLTGSLQTPGFGSYSGATGTIANTLNSTISQHLMKLSKIRQAVPALRYGQYTTSGCSGTMAFIKRYTSCTTDSVAAVAISSASTFSSLPNGTYVDLVSGKSQVVGNGTLSVTGLSQAQMAVYVLQNASSGTLSKIGGSTTYLG